MDIAKLPDPTGPPAPPAPAPPPPPPAPPRAAPAPPPPPPPPPPRRPPRPRRGPRQRGRGADAARPADAAADQPSQMGDDRDRRQHDRDLERDHRQLVAEVLLVGRFMVPLGLVGPPGQQAVAGGERVGDAHVELRGVALGLRGLPAFGPL